MQKGNSMSIKPEKQKKQVIQHMACRADRPCGGNRAVQTMKMRRPGGGYTCRYKCLKCGRSFMLSN